jgi:hypothetical protein
MLSQHHSPVLAVCTHRWLCHQRCSPPPPHRAVLCHPLPSNTPLCHSATAKAAAAKFRPAVPTLRCAADATPRQGVCTTAMLLMKDSTGPHPRRFCPGAPVEWAVQSTATKATTQTHTARQPASQRPVTSRPLYQPLVTCVMPAAQAVDSCLVSRHKTDHHRSCSSPGSLAGCACRPRPYTYGAT